MLESKKVMEVLTQQMFLVWAVSIYFRFLIKKTTHYHPSLIDTFNLSAENRGKHTKDASILQNLQWGGAGRGGRGHCASPQTPLAQWRHWPLPSS